MSIKPTTDILNGIHSVLSFEHVRNFRCCCHTTYFSRFKIYPRHNTKLLPIPKRKRRLNTKTNYWISYLNNSWKRTELKMDIIWETHQYGNKSQRLLLFIFMHVSRVTSSAPTRLWKRHVYLGAQNFCFVMLKIVVGKSISWFILILILSRLFNIAI